MEKKVYLIDIFKTKCSAPDQLSDEAFIKEATENGFVYTLKEFEKAFNDEEINSSTDIIRIL